MFMAACTPVGVIPPQDVNLSPEPRTIMLSEMVAELGWTFDIGTPTPDHFQARSPQGDLVTFRSGSDLVIINSTRWRQERDAVENRIGNDLLLPESTFNFVCRRFGQHHLVRQNVRTGDYVLQPIHPHAPAPAKPAEPEPVVPRDNLLSGLVICVDPGHGGQDPGGMANGVVEKEICLAVSLLLQRRLEMSGAKVIMTRTTDVYPTLDERCELANRNRAHMFVSVHANIAPNDSSVQGFEVFYKGGSAGGERLARDIIAAMDRAIDSPNRGAKVDPRGLRVLEHTTMPAVLVELGFMSNAQEARRLNHPAYQRILAEALYQGIAANWAHQNARVSR
jgi:N-acetylmuramoyl-L-alanine amidase CwlD